MPTNSESHHESDRDKDTGRDEEKGGSKQKATFKSKDLSHVPCKFHKFGRCAAGPLCPFSHGSVEPRAQKQTCKWFIKGNCRFGNKCALAHVLPGQSIAMDGRNKKAPRTTASGASGRKDGKLASGGTRRADTPISQFLHSRDRMTVDSGYGWGELAERKENLHTTSFKRDVTLVVELEHPPHVHRTSSSRDRPDLMQWKNLNVSGSCILPSSVGKFNDPTLSLVNADAHTGSDVLPPDEPPPETRFGIPVPPRNIRFLDNHEDGQALLKYIIHDNLRSRRHVVNSASTAGSRPSPMISGASDPFTPEIH